MVQARQREWQIDVVGFVPVAIKPGTIQPPGIMRVEAEREYVARRQMRDVREIPTDLQAKVPVNGRPGGVRRGDHVESPVVDVTNRRGAGAEVRAGGKIAAAAFHAESRALPAKRLPEPDDLLANPRRHLWMEGLAIEDRAFHAPRRGGESEA